MSLEKVLFKTGIPHHKLETNQAELQKRIKAEYQGKHSMLSLVFF